MRRRLRQPLSRQPNGTRRLHPRRHLPGWIAELAKVCSYASARGLLMQSMPDISFRFDRGYGRLRGVYWKGEPDRAFILDDCVSR